MGHDLYYFEAHLSHPSTCSSMIPHRCYVQLNPWMCKNIRAGRAKKTPFFCGWTPKVLVKVSHLQIEKKKAIPKVAFLGGGVFFPGQLPGQREWVQRLPRCPGLMSASAEDCQSHRLSNEFKPSTSPRCNSRMLLDHGNSKLKTLKKWERSPLKGIF